MIDGVTCTPISLYPDDRGFFLEVIRLSDVPTAQVSASLSYPGTIKAFHFHRHQTDIWTPVKGMFQVVLHDLRENSPTYRETNTFFAGELKPTQITIPPGVAHGYKVIGAESGLLVYLTDKFYNPDDEGRIPYNDPAIAYNWETQFK